MITRRTLKSIKEEIANSIGASSAGMRGLGNHTGTPNIEDDSISAWQQDNIESGDSKTDQILKAMKDGHAELHDSSTKGYHTAHTNGYKGTLKEDASTNNVGAGADAGMGTTAPGKPANWAEPGARLGQRKIKEDDPRNPTLFQSVVRRGMFAGEETFIVPSHVFERAYHAKAKGKHWKTYIAENDFIPEIREFAKKYPHKPIIFEDEKTGYMMHARYARKKQKRS